MVHGSLENNHLKREYQNMFNLTRMAKYIDRLTHLLRSDILDDNNSRNVIRYFKVHLSIYCLQVHVVGREKNHTCSLL